MTFRLRLSAGLALSVFRVLPLYASPSERNLIVDIIGHFQLTGIGRELPFISAVFQQFERPLSGKADIQVLSVSPQRV